MNRKRFATLASGAGIAAPLAATHHGSWDVLESSFPSIRFVRRKRFVEHERVATAGGLTSGIDLALRVVERYLGRDAARATAAYMEHERRQIL